MTAKGNDKRVIYTIAFPERRNNKEDPNQSVLYRMNIHTGTNVHTGTGDQDKDKDSRYRLSQGHQLLSFPETSGPYMHHQDFSWEMVKLRKELSPRKPKGDHMKDFFFISQLKFQRSFFRKLYFSTACLKKGYDENMTPCEQCCNYSLSLHPAQQ